MITLLSYVRILGNIAVFMYKDDIVSRAEILADKGAQYLIFLGEMPPNVFGDNDIRMF